MLEDARTRERMAAVLATPEMQRALADLSGGLSQGVVKGLSSEQLSAEVDKLVGVFVHALMREMASSLNGDFGPAIDAFATKRIDNAFGVAFSPAHQEQMDRFTNAVVGSVMRSVAQEIPKSMGPALRQTMTDDLGPAMRDMMQKDLAPGMAAMITTPELKAALAQTAREVAHQAVLGSNEGLAEVAEQRKHDKSANPLGVVGSFFTERTWLLAALVVGLALAVPLAWLVRERRLARKRQAEIERRNARAAALLGAMEASPDGTYSNNLLAMLREQLLEETIEATPKELERTMGPPSAPRPRHA